MFAMLQYFIDDLPKRRKNPRNGIIDDLLTLEVDGRSLTEEELLGFCILFVIAGHETTTKMVANAIDLLSRHPDQKRDLANNLDLAPQAVEEVVRFHNSTQYMHRTMTKDLSMHGETFEKATQSFSSSELPIMMNENLDLPPENSTFTERMTDTFRSGMVRTSVLGLLLPEWKERSLLKKFTAASPITKSTMMRKSAFTPAM